MKNVSIVSKFRTFLILIVALLCLCKIGHTFQHDRIVRFSDASNEILLNRHISIFKDASKKLPINSVKQQNFAGYPKDGIINLGATKDRVWLKFTVQNDTDDEDLYLLLQQATIDEAILFLEHSNGDVLIDTLGKYKPFEERAVYAPDYIFPINVKKASNATIYLGVSSNDQMQLPLYIGSKEAISTKMSTKNLLFGLYAGAVLIMMLYNLFIGLSTRNGSYIYYIVYIFTVGLTQAMFQGYAYMYLWPNSPWMASRSSIIIPFL